MGVGLYSDNCVSLDTDGVTIRLTTFPSAFPSALKGASVMAMSAVW